MTAPPHGSSAAPRAISGRLICLVLAAPLYPLLVYVALSSGHRGLAVAAAGLVALTILRSPRLRLIVVIACLSLGALLSYSTTTWPGVQALAFAPPVLINLGIAWLFGRTLLPGREPLISTFARFEQGGTLPADLGPYTRRLTLIWAVFTASMALVSVMLAALGWLVAWSWFTGVINYALVVLLFVGEWRYRRWRFAHHRHFSLLEMRQYLKLLPAAGKPPHQTD